MSRVRVFSSKGVVGSDHNVRVTKHRRITLTILTVILYCPQRVQRDEVKVSGYVSLQRSDRDINPLHTS